MSAGRQRCGNATHMGEKGIQVDVLPAVDSDGAGAHTDRQRLATNGDRTGLYNG